MVNDRVKELRKELGLNQTEFGDKIGLTNATVSRIEKGIHNLTEQGRILIIKEFRVNPEWLDTGQGDMFKEDEDEVIAELTAEYGLDELDQRIVRGYIRMTPEERAIFKKYLEDVFFPEIIKERAEKKPRKIPLYEIKIDEVSNVSEFKKVKQVPLYKAAGGEAIEFDGQEPLDMVDVPEDKEKATFAVKIEGDSMSPMLCDGDYVYAKAKDILDPGQLGIFEFMENGEAKYTCKKYCINESGEVQLISINPRYEPLKLNADEIKIKGKVIL
jgi:SOS-response transcriptional repressor LexA